MPVLPHSSAAGVGIPDDLVTVGYVAGAYGIGGWVKVRPYSAEADALLQVKNWWLDKPALHDTQVMKVKRHAADVVAQLMGVAGRDAAEALKGATVQVRRSHFPALEVGEFYWLDLIGLDIENLQQEALGKVTGLMDNGAHPILRVAPSGVAAQELEAAELLIPFVDQFIIAVDQAGKKITVDWGRDY